MDGNTHDAVEILRQATDRNFHGGTWHHGLDDALSDLSAGDAGWRPHPDVPTIWEHVRHLAVWKRELTGLLRGGTRTESLYGKDHQDWPAPPPNPGEEEWKQSLRALTEAQEELDRALAESGWIEADLPHLTSPAANVLGCMAHDSYHCGQIILIRRLRGLWHAPGEGEATIL